MLLPIPDSESWKDLGFMEKIAIIVNDFFVGSHLGSTAV
jgi:hypothetical protein